MTSVAFNNDPVASLLHQKSTTPTRPFFVIAGKRIAKESLLLIFALLLCISLSAGILHQSAGVYVKVRDKVTLSSDGTKSPEHRVAVCVAGGVRSFPIPAVHESLRHNFIVPLHDLNRTDVFFKLQNTSDQEGCAQMAKKYPYHTVEAAMKKFNPVYSDFHNPTCSESVINQSSCCKSPTYHNASEHDGEWNSWRSYVRKTSCINQVLAHEKEHNIHYDWVVLVRPDMAFLEPTMFRLSALLPNRVYISSKEGGQPMGDYIYLIPRSLLTEFNVILSTYNDKHCQEFGHPSWPAEYALHPYMEHEVRMAYQVIPFLFVLMRCTGKDAWCGRLANEVFHHAKFFRHGSARLSPEKMCEFIVRNDSFFPDFLPYTELKQIS